MKTGFFFCFVFAFKGTVLGLFFKQTAHSYALESPVMLQEFGNVYF